MADNEDLSVLFGEVIPIPSSEIRTRENDAIRQNSLTQENIRQIVSSTPKRRKNIFSSSQISKSKNSTVQSDVIEISPLQISSSQISPLQIGFNQTGISHINISQIRITQDLTSNSSTNHTSSGKIDPVQTNMNLIEIESHQVSPSQVQTSGNSYIYVSNSQSWTTSSPPSSHFSNSSQIINALNNIATNIWSNLLQPSIQLEIKFQITDLPKGQLAEATITGFNENGTPNAGTILIDHDAKVIGWFIDSTPWENSEFAVVGDKEDKGETYLLAAAESEANGKYDQLTYTWNFDDDNVVRANCPLPQPINHGHSAIAYVCGDAIALQNI